MKIGFDRNVEEIQLFGKTLKIASLTINDLIALDLINGEGLNLQPGHLNIHKMLVAITYALSINYEIVKYTWGMNPFKYFADCYRKAGLKRLLSYNSLKAKLTLKNIIDINTAIERLNSFRDEDDVKKKTE